MHCTPVLLHGLPTDIHCHSHLPHTSSVLRYTCVSICSTLHLSHSCFNPHVYFTLGTLVLLHILVLSYTQLPDLLLDNLPLHASVARALSELPFSNMRKVRKDSLREREREYQLKSRTRVRGTETLGVYSRRFSNHKDRS